MNNNKTISTIMKTMLITAAPALTSCSTVSEQAAPAAPSPTIKAPTSLAPAPVSPDADGTFDTQGRKRPKTVCGVRG